MKLYKDFIPGFQVSDIETVFSFATDLIILFWGL